MVEIDDEKRNLAVQRFVTLAGLPSSAAQKLVEAALQAAVNQTLDMIMGSGPVPSAMTATRADELRYVCLQAGRVLSQREVGVLFRTTPANARAILTAMSATYEQALYDKFIAEMHNAAIVSRSGNVESGLKWKVRFTQEAAYDTARAELERLELLKLATFDGPHWTVEFSQPAANGDVDLLEKLGLKRPDEAQAGRRR